MSDFRNFVQNRIGWKPYLKPFFYKKLPSGLGWSVTLGSLCALTFVMLAATGIFLAMYYVPSPDKAYESVNYIMTDVRYGDILRGLHHWGAGFMVALVFVHMMHCFFAGSFKAPREMTWLAGVVLFLIILAMGFTGYLLPWDQKAYWATVVSTNIARDIPLGGEFLASLMLGGDRVSGLTLTRFFSLHVLLLPALLMSFAVFHIYLVRIHGISPSPENSVGREKTATSSPGAIYRFYPEHLLKSSIAFSIVLALIFLLAVYWRVPLEEKAGTLDPAYLPRPEWYYMWLFQLLTFFPGSWEVIGSLVIPVAGLVLLFSFPWLDRSRWRGMANRPVITALGFTVFIAIVYLTLMGFCGVRPYGRIFVVPDHPLSVSEIKGLQLYAARDCAYCHTINGRGGRAIGPDLANMVAKDRTQASLIKFIKDPQSVNRWSAMPKYDLDGPSLQALVDFVLSLNFKDYQMKIISREDVTSGRVK